MSISYVETGRTRQKARTRDAMVGAVRQLLADNVTPTVELAADRAGVSRATAYRYFPNQRALLAASYPELDAGSLLDEDAPEDPLARLEIVTERIGRQLIDHEPELRATLRLSLESPPPEEGLPLRRGRVARWIEDALVSLEGRMPAADLRRLVLAIRATLGVEAMAWLTDVGGLTPEDAVELMRSSAHTLLRAALADG